MKAKEQFEIIKDQFESQVDEASLKGETIPYFTIDVQDLKLIIEYGRKLEKENELWKKMNNEQVYQKELAHYKNESYREAIETALGIARPNAIYSSECSDIEVILSSALEESE